MNDYKNFLDRHSKYLRYLLVLSFITFVILLAATSAQGCVGARSVSSDTVANPNTSITISHTVSGTNRLMLVGVSINNNDEVNDYVSSVTWNGTESLNQVGHVEQVDDARVEIWMLVAPSTGTHNLVVNFNALSMEAVVGVVSFTGVDQTNPLRTAPATFAWSKQDNTALATLDIPSGSGELVFGVVAAEDRTLAASSGQREQWNLSLGGTSGYRTSGAGGTAPGASSSVTMSWDLTGTDHWAMGGVSIMPAASAGSLVMVTGDGSYWSGVDDNAKKTLFESWGYTVTAIDDDTASYSTAALNNDVMYISESVGSTTVGTKPVGLDIGIVVGENWCWDNLGFATSGDSSGWTNSITIADNSHYITSPFATGNLVVYTSDSDIGSLPVGLASGGQLLATENNLNGPTLFVFETGASLTSGTAANRRVGFPDSTSNPSNWNADFETLLQRSLQWAAGCDGGGGGGGGGNNPPTVDAGSDDTITLPASANLDGTADDGGDGPGPFTTTWSKVSGPGNVTFGDASAQDTTASFSAAGTYVLKLTANDGADTAEDTVTITVNSSGGLPAPDLNEYSCNMKITINSGQVAGDLNYFPVLISLTDESLKTSGCGFVTDPDGDDIIFINSAKTIQLYHEIEKYDGTTGELVGWVLVPALSGSSNTDIYMYFGNSNVTTFQGDSTAVWDSNYVGVWHLYDTSGNTQDSTSYNTDGALSGTVTRGATGKIDNAFDFSTNGEVDWGDPADGHLDFGTGEMTLSLWVNMDNHRGVWEQVILKGKSSWEPGYQIEVNASGYNFYFTINDGSHSEWGVSTNISFSLDTWTHVVGVVDRTNNLLRAYKDGVQVDTSNISTVGSIDVGDVLTLGRDNWGWPDARIEEVRLSRTARSADWILTSYNNQNSPSSFYSVEKNCPTTIPPISEFTCSIPLTIDSSKVSGTSDLFDFPVLISLTNTSLKTTGSCGYVQNSNGYDIIFSDATQTTVLDHEIEKYDGASGELIAWVKVPTLSATTDTTIYVHFGHSSICGATENPTGVWDSNYTTVWHLKETSGGSGALKDSTARANHGTDFNSPTFGATGKIGNAIDFDGANDYATMPTSGFSTSAGTVELWANIDTFPSSDNKYMFSHFTPSPTGNRVYVNLKPDNTWGTGMGDTYDLVRGSVVNADTWYHLVLTWDGTNARGYKDGILNFGPTAYSGLTTVGNIYVSAWDGTDEWFDGTLDELRVSDSARSADWIKTSYNNQSNPSSFYSVGASSCFLAGFSCNRKITIDSTKVEGSSDLTNFPFLIKIQNDCNLKTAANGGGVQNSNGWDIIFTDSDGATQLDHEIEDYDGTTGDLTAWVRVPTLPYNSDKDIYMYYGKDGLTCDPSNPTGVWDSSYEAVYHLNDDFEDSTSHNRDATAEDTDNYGAVIADGENFGPQDEIAIGNWSFSGNELTLQAWARFDDFDQDDPRVFSKANGTSEQNHVFMLGLGGNLEQHLRMRLKTGTDDLSGTTTTVDTDDPLSTGTWYLIAGTYDGSNMRLLSNGVQVHSVAKTGNLRVNSWNIALGNHPGNTDTLYASMDGKLDEARILSVARSANWLRTEYNNQSDPDSFYSMSQDTCGGAYGFNYQYCKKITVDHTQVSSSLTRYPLLINITGDDDLKTVTNGGRVQHPQGYDIVFKTSGCVNYDHEIEKYDGANGDLVAWVQIPTLSSSTDSEIYMYYGANVVCDPSNPTAVWDDRFRAVYHLNDDFEDSTQYNRDGTNYGATFAASKIGNGALFDPSDGWDYIDLGTWSMSTDDITIQAWVWPNDFNQDDPRIVSKGSPTGVGTQDHVYMLSLYDGDNGENRMRLRVKTGTDDLLNTVELFGTSPNGYLPSAQNWYFLAGTYEDDNSAGTEMRLYRDNGLDAGQVAHAGNLRENSWPVYIGASPYGSSNTAKTWDGILDEVRILSSDLSQDWLATEYRNHNDPGNFYSISSCFEQTTEVTQEWVEEVQ